jgi:acyl dehydratase
MMLSDLVTTHRRELGASSWRTVDQHLINSFADVTGDHQWIHVDPIRAAAGGFGATIAHGYLLLSLVPSILDEVLVVRDRRTGVNYGINRLRFTGAVRSGSRLRGRVALAQGVRRPDGGVLLTLDVTLEREHESTPAMVAELLTLAFS